MGEQVDARLNQKASFLLRRNYVSSRSNKVAYGGVAQLGEHLPCKQGVMSSNLTISTLALSHAKSRRQTRVKLA